MSEIRNVDVHNIEPDLIDLYQQKYELKDKLSFIDKAIGEYQSEKINALRQVEGLKKYTGESREFRISYFPPKEYFSWVVRADPDTVRDFFNNIIFVDYGNKGIEKFNKLINNFVNSLLERKVGYEKYIVARHKKPKEHLHETTLDVNIVTEQET